MTPLLPSPTLAVAVFPSPLAEAAARLEQEVRSRPATGVAPLRLRLSAISIEDAFNVRGHKLDDYHIGQLGRSLAAVADLAPILIMQRGTRFVLVDGHHRLVAYRRARRPDVPVELFVGSPREALLAATSRNTAAALQMDNRQRQDCAWRLVNADFTLKEIGAAAGVSRAQISGMRKVRKVLGDDAASHDQWWKARRASEGRVMEPLTDDELDAMVEAHAQRLADALRKATGNKIATNPEIGARAMAILLGRTLGEFHRQLGGHLTEEHMQMIESEENGDF